MSPAGDDDFEQTWRHRFERYGDAHDDDAGIAGWSSGGLAARVRRFIQLWERTSAEASGQWLDAGCGAGTYTRYLAERGLQVTAVDYSFPTTRKARERGPANVLWATADVTRLPFRDASFDGALCFGVMQALAGPERAAQELRRVLRRDAIVWVDALNAHCVPSAYGEFARRFRGRPQHLRYDASRRFCAALQSVGFGSIERYWVPVLPSRFQRFQGVVDRPSMQGAFARLPLLGAALSHSFLVRARAV